MDKERMVENLLNKGVYEVFPSKEFLKKKLLSGEKMKVYAGFDPTSPNLHIGHAILLRKLKQFQGLGHKVIFLVGDFTATIGDPTDKISVRSQLTQDQVKKNLKNYKKQAGKIVSFSGKNKAEIKFNSKWLSKIKLSDFLSLASLVTVDQMLKRDMFENRSKEGKPIYLHEFMYPLLQGYDSVAMGVDIEVGGSDQTFNMLAGRSLLKQLKNKEKFVITMKLLEDSSGKKMSKSEGNIIALDDTPEDIFGSVMGWTDGMIESGFELCTNLTKDEVLRILENNNHPMDQKKKLAFYIVEEMYGKEKAKVASENFESLFQKKEITESILSFKNTNERFEDFLINKNFVSSKSEVRRLVENGAVVNLEENTKLKPEDMKNPINKGVYRVGKTRFFKVI